MANSASFVRHPLIAALILLALIWSVMLLTDTSSLNPSLYISTSNSQSQSKLLSKNVGKSANEILAPSVSASSKDFAGLDHSAVSLSSDKFEGRPLVLFAYSESDSARRNLEFFLAHGVHGAADFVFIINGPSDAGTLIPKRSNFAIVERPNDCYDLGAYAEVLTQDDLYRKYTHFIFINASVRGPFLPTWSPSCWSDMYLRKVTEKVKLVGMTGNCWPKFHVQSMIWATDIIGLEELLFPREQPASATTLAWPPESTEIPPEPGINHCFHDWKSAVFAEVGASQIIRNAGFEIDVMMTAYHGAADGDYEGRCDPEENGDVLWQGKYEGTNVNPYETIFMKTNRDIDPVLIERLTEWHDNAKYSSYDYCS